MIRAGLVDQTDHAFCDVRVDLVDDLPGFAEELLRVIHESLCLSCSLVFSKVILDMNLQAKQLIPEHGNQNGTGTDEISRAGWVIVE